MENMLWMVTVFYHGPVSTACNSLKFDELNFDCLAGKHQASKFLLTKFCAIQYIARYSMAHYKREQKTLSVTESSISS